MALTIKYNYTLYTGKKIIITSKEDIQPLRLQRTKVWVPNVCIIQRVHCIDTDMVGNNLLKLGGCSREIFDF